MRNGNIATEQSPSKNAEQVLKKVFPQIIYRFSVTQFKRSGTGGSHMNDIVCYQEGKKLKIMTKQKNMTRKSIIYVTPIFMFNIN